MQSPHPKGKKPDDTLSFSDLTSAQPTGPVLSSSPVSQPPGSSDSSTQPHSELPDTLPTQPTVSGQPTQPEPAQATKSFTSPTADIPTFRNPHGASQQVDLVEMGAQTPFPPVAPPTDQPLPKIRFNLSPNFDTFVAHGLQAQESGKAATTLLGKVALALKLNVIFSRRNLRYASVGLVSFLVFLLVFNFQTILTQITYRLNPPKPNAPIEAVTDPTPSANLAQAIDAPDQIIIPKLGVTAPIVFEPSISEQAIQLALRNGVVHYAGTALPGEPSNSVIVGHSSNDWWEPGNYKFIFANLDKLEAGDQIQVNYQKKKYVYQVTSKKIVAPSEVSVLQPTAEPILTLITCTPPGTSWKRLIITSNQIEPAPKKPDTTPQVAVNEAANKAALPGNAPSLFDQILRWVGLKKNSEGATPSSSPQQSPAGEQRNYLPQAV